MSFFATFFNLLAYRNACSGVKEIDRPPPEISPSISVGNTVHILLRSGWHASLTRRDLRAREFVFVPTFCPHFFGKRRDLTGKTWNTCDCGAPAKPLKNKGTGRFWPVLQSCERRELNPHNIRHETLGNIMIQCFRTRFLPTFCPHFQRRACPTCGQPERQGRRRKGRRRRPRSWPPTCGRADVAPL